MAGADATVNISAFGHILYTISGRKTDTGSVFMHLTFTESVGRDRYCFVLYDDHFM